MITKYFFTNCINKFLKHCYSPLILTELVGTHPNPFYTNDEIGLPPESCLDSFVMTRVLRRKLYFGEARYCIW